MIKTQAISNTGIEHTYFEVSKDFFNPLIQDFLNRRIIKGSDVIDPLQKDFNRVDDVVPIATEDEVEYIFRGNKVVNPKKLMYYSKELNAIRFPHIGEYYKTSTFVD